MLTISIHLNRKLHFVQGKLKTCLKRCAIAEIRR